MIFLFSDHCYSLSLARTTGLCASSSGAHSCQHMLLSCSVWPSLSGHLQGRQSAWAISSCLER